MSTLFPFQYALLRYVHDALTGEFLNIGLIIYSKEANYFRAMLLDQYGRISNAFPDVNGEVYSQFTRKLQNKLDEIGKKIMDEQNVLIDDDKNFEQLLNELLPASDSTHQFSDIRGGISVDLEKSFSDMYMRYVSRYLERDNNETRTDDDVWAEFRKPLQERNVVSHLIKHTVSTPYGLQKFSHALKNGALHLLEPTSLDLLRPTSIRKKVYTLNTEAQLLREAEPSTFLHILIGAPKSEDPLIEKAYNDSLKLLTERTKKLGNIEIVEENSADAFAKKMHDLAIQHLKRT